MNKNTVQCVVLTQKAEVKNARISCSEKELDLATLKTYLKKKENPEILGTYKYKTLILTLFGYSKGKAGTENKHELPPPLDNNLYFGDIVLVASTAPANYSKPTTFKSEDYETFYTKMFGGFEDLDSDEDEDSEEEEEEEEVVAEAEAEAEVVAEEEDEEEEDDEEEEEEEDDEEEVEEEKEEEEAPRISSKASPKKKKVQPNLLTSQTGISQILHCPKEEHLTPTANPNVPLRKKSRTLIQVTLSENRINDLSINDLEQKIYEATLKDAEQRHVTAHWNNKLFQHLYETKVRHILGNLIPTSYIQNTKLLQSLRTGSFTIETLCTADTYALHNDRWKDYIHVRAQREKRQLEGNKAMATDQFLCTRCHKRECTYYEMQTRSADEPMTIFITCINCGKHWRQ
jgi:DNA-directed RNA polymerase subunit M/transcription elongation factor TFIIS